MKTIKYKNKYLSCVSKQFYKFAVVLIVVSIFANILVINPTSAYFTDEATITGTEFSMGTLDLSVDSTDFGTVGLGIDKNLIISNTGSLPFEYGIEAEFSETSDIAFCNQLNISVKEGANILYSGNILTLNFTEPKIIGVGGQNDLIINITDPSDSVIGRTCNLQLASKAWQDELSYEQGFTDIAYTSAVINSEKEPTSTDGNVVLNEFLANPEGYQYGFDFGGDNSLMPQGEWIELYNNGDEDINVNGWSIMNRTLAIKRFGHFDYGIEPVITTVVIDSSHTRDGNTVIPAHGWLVVYMNKEIISNYVGDITLYNSTNTQKDYIRYGALVDHCYLSPTPGDTNDNDPSGVCLLGIPENKSYARIPDGVGAWVDPIPTPGDTNIEENILESDIVEINNIDGKEEVPEVTETPVVKQEKSDIEVKDEEIIATEELIEQEPVILEEQKEEIANTEVIVVEEPVVEEEGEETVIEEPVVTEKVEEVTETPVEVAEALVVEVPTVESVPTE
jgi:predicted ribosomally synthesized peptide with SipW-like signal peptide